MFLKNFSEYHKINELVSNKKLANHHFIKVLDRLVKITGGNYRPNTDYNDYNENNIKYTFNYDVSKGQGLFNKIKKYLFLAQANLLRKNLVLSFRLSTNVMTNLPNGHIELYLKDLYAGRTSSPRYLYHTTNVKNVKKILKEGIKLKSHDQGNYKYQVDLYYPPSIFVSIEELYFGGRGASGERVNILIDTSKINNKWYYDLNLYHVKSFYMTFEEIPPHALMLLT